MWLSIRQENLLNRLLNFDFLEKSAIIRRFNQISMKNFPKKVLSLFVIVGLLLFFGVYSVMQYQTNYLTGYTGINFDGVETQNTNETSTTTDDNNDEDEQEDEQLELSSEDKEFFEDNKIQCLDTTPSSFTVCKFFMPVGKRLTNNTMQIKIGANKNPNPSSYCQQDAYQTVMCGYVQTPPKKGRFVIELKIGDEYIDTNSTMDILLPGDFANKYRTAQGPQFTIQYGGGYMDNLNDVTNSRCEEYFEDIRSNNPMCFKLTVLRELNIFNGQKNKNENRKPLANLNGSLTRSQFFTLAYRFLKQTEFISETGNPRSLAKFDDVEVKDTANSSNHWWMKPTSYLLERGIINGYADNTIKPNAKVSESEIAKVLAEIKGYTYEGIEGQPWYTEVVDLYRLRGYRINPTKAANRQMAADLLHFSLGL